jgi:putative transposase
MMSSGVLSTGVMNHAPTHNKPISGVMNHAPTGIVPNVGAQFIAPATTFIAPDVPPAMSKSLPTRKPMRLPHYDYSQNGAYFITLCTHNRDCMFGNVVDGGMVLNKAGQIVESEWQQLPTHYPNVTLDACVVMPNHVHMVIILMNAGKMDSGVMTAGVMNHAPTNNVSNVGAQFIAPATTTVGNIIRAFKARCTYLINQHQQTQGLSVWQRGYYDHIVRNDADLTRIRDYIANNPAQWELDENNPNLFGCDKSRPYDNNKAKHHA